MGNSADGICTTSSEPVCQSSAYSKHSSLKTLSRPTKSYNKDDEVNSVNDNTPSNSEEPGGNGSINSESCSNFFASLWPPEDSKCSKKSATDEQSWSLMPVMNGSNDTSLTSLQDALWQKSDANLLGGIFSTRKPKDAGAGIASGLKSVGKGVAAGAASLVVCPIVGATNEGLGGFFKGIGAGVFAALALPLTGIGVAGYQFARGVANTPEAVMEKSHGRKWDKKKRIWKDNWYSLEEEIKEINELKKEEEKEEKNDESSKGHNKQRTNRKVVDMTFYDILEVSADATQEDIRKQYYKSARKCHPDKHPDDPEAKIKFQKLGEAYQVLGDEDRRAKYDECGISAAHEMPIIDSSLFFMMLFGSEQLEPYIGKLKMAMVVELMEKKKSSELTEDLLEKEQRAREVLLAISLRDRLELFVHNKGNAEEVEAWRNSIISEAQTLCQSSFGDAIIEAIGWTYENYASQYLGKLDTFLGLKGRYAKMQAQSRSMGNSWKTASSALRAALATREIQQKEIKKLKKKNRSNRKDEDKKKSMDDADEATNDKGNKKDGEIGEDNDTSPSAADLSELENTLPLILETILNICLLDVECTVRASCKKVLKDMSVDIDIRRDRAEGLIDMGKIFQDVAEKNKKSSKPNKLDARRHMEEAFLKAAQKADEDRIKKDTATYGQKENETT